MATANGDTFRAKPSASRYALVGLLLTILLAYPSFLFLALCSALAKAIADHSQIAGLLGDVGLGIGLFSFLTAYMANVFIFSITLHENNFSFRNGNCAITVHLSEVKKICYLDSFKGWMYIIVYTSHGSYKIPNALHFDSQFNTIKDGIADWLARYGAENLVYREQIRADKIGAFRSQQLPFSILKGIWNHVAFFTAFAMVVTFATGLLKLNLFDIIGHPRG